MDSPIFGTFIGILIMYYFASLYHCKEKSTEDISLEWSEEYAFKTLIKLILLKKNLIFIILWYNVCVWVIFEIHVYKKQKLMATLPQLHNTLQK